MGMGQARTSGGGARTNFYHLELNKSFWRGGVSRGRPFNNMLASLIIFLILLNLT